MSIKCEVYEQTAQPTLSVRTHTSVEQLPQALGAAYAAIGQYLGSLGETPGGAPFVAYYNMNMENLDVEIGFPVVKAFPGSGTVQSGEMPAGKFATCLHKGPYNECGQAYEQLTRWVQEQGYETTGLAYEFYLNDPAETPPQELKTQIVFQLKTD